MVWLLIGLFLGGFATGYIFGSRVKAEVYSIYEAFIALEKTDRERVLALFAKIRSKL